MIGGTKEDGCQKKLTLDAYTDHAEEPYCNGCYRKLFGPKVYLGGSATLQSDINATGEDVIKNDRFFKVTAVDPYLLNPLGELARQKAEEEAREAAEKEAEAAAAASAEAAAKAAAEAKAKVTPTTPKPTIASTCAKCSKGVSMGDRRTGCSKVWHTDCFTCGGVTADGCGKRLAADQFMSLNANPFCKVCFSRVTTGGKRLVTAPELEQVQEPVVEESKPAPVYSPPARQPAPQPAPQPEPEPEPVIDTSAFDDEPEDPEITALNSAMRGASFEPTKPLDAVSMADMEKLLVNLCMSRYVSQFTDNDISGKILAEVSTEEELRECEIDLPGPVSRAFMNFLSEAKDTGVKLSLLV